MGCSYRVISKPTTHQLRNRGICQRMAQKDTVAISGYDNVQYCTLRYINKGVKMRTVTSTEFRKDASALFSAVEDGETIRVIRHGKPIAEILPFRDTIDKQPSWKKKRVKRLIKGKELSSIILSERES